MFFSWNRRVSRTIEGSWLVKIATRSFLYPFFFFQRLIIIHWNEKTRSVPSIATSFFYLVFFWGGGPLWYLPAQRSGQSVSKGSRSSGLRRIPLSKCVKRKKKFCCFVLGLFGKNKRILEAPLRTPLPESIWKRSSISFGIFKGRLGGYVLLFRDVERSSNQTIGPSQTDRKKISEKNIKQTEHHR